MVLSKIVFLIVAIILSIFIAKKVVNLQGAGASGSKGFTLWRDYILNFIGCALGWSAIYYFLFLNKGQKLEIVDLLIILFGYVGITGYLPHLIINKGLKP